MAVVLAVQAEALAAAQAVAQAAAQAVTEEAAQAAAQLAKYHRVVAVVPRKDWPLLLLPPLARLLLLPLPLQQFIVTTRCFLESCRCRQLWT